MSYTRRPLSASTDGRGIKVVAVATAGTLIHTALADATKVDVLCLEAYNSDVQDRILTLECGGVTAPDDHKKFRIPAGATVPIVLDMVLRNSLALRAFADAANVVVIHGFVNREA